MCLVDTRPSWALLNLGFGLQLFLVHDFSLRLFDPFTLFASLPSFLL